jgi:CRP-like cAMP-binding protein
MVGTTVETTIRVMSRFRKSGYLKDVEGKIVITDLAALKSIVNPE